MEQNLVEIWLRRDPIRWIAGSLAGLFAGIITIGFAMLISYSSGMDPWFPAKLVATVALGPSATDFNEGFQAILVGVTLFEATCLVLGAIYAHFTGTNFLGALLPMGVVWGVFSWIFIWNLFLQSFHTIYTAQISSALVFPICIVFGVALASVAWFDERLR